MLVAELGVRRLRLADPNNRAIDVVHRQKGRRHTGCGAQKDTAGKATLFRQDPGTLREPRLKFLLQLALRGRQKFAVRNHLGGNWRRKAIGFGRSEEHALLGGETVGHSILAKDLAL